ncbi:phosphodiester glycosidase family protein [Bacillus sp. BP-3]|uniref:phosphodiester glycosidase family protein n=1 Tax=Bacillus sp. BP-3 TaxID=3022773 RepID=UPI00232E14D2|nr:phosphodiester glycosidase family protein [Bacillus sp. BP-3]MDC2864248.1 phosphodiester glycosidase family protein [Bacillus sp. BP-3]
MKNRIKKGIKKISIITLIVLTGGVIWLYATNSGHKLREMIGGSILSSQHPQFARLLLSKDEIHQLQTAIYAPPTQKSKLLNGLFSRKKQPFSVTVETIEDPHFTAKVMKVNDPTTIHLVSTKYHDQGQPLSDLIEQNEAIAGINAGGFIDPGGVGRGGQIIGIALSDGIIRSEPGFSQDTRNLVCGFTKKGQFITGMYSINELKHMNVTQAVAFGPQLIVDGKNMVTDQVEEAFGWAPRTGIGQDTEGNVIMIVTDGRFYWNKNHRGASMRDMVSLFKKYGCIDAFALDGGGSTTMIYKGKLQLKPATETSVGMRYLPNAFVVIPKK